MSPAIRTIFAAMCICGALAVTAALIGTLLVVFYPQGDEFNSGFWIDTSSWALPVALTWESGRWTDGRWFWQATIQVLCFYWRAGSPL